MKDLTKKERLSNLFHRLLLQKIAVLKDPLWKIVNINSVKISKNKQKYFIFYTLWQKKELKTVERFLQKNKSKIKQMISQEWMTHRLPELVFVHDQNLINAEKIQVILDEIKQN